MTGWTTSNTYVPLSKSELSPQCGTDKDAECPKRCRRRPCLRLVAVVKDTRSLAPVIPPRPRGTERPLASCTSRPPRRTDHIDSLHFHALLSVNCTILSLPIIIRPSSHTDHARDVLCTEPQCLRDLQDVSSAGRYAKLANLSCEWVLRVLCSVKSVAMKQNLSAIPAYGEAQNVQATGRRNPSFCTSSATRPNGHN